MNDNRYVRVVDSSEDEDTNIYCPMCEKLGFTALMGAKIILAGQQREPDHDHWLQCPSCGWLCPIHEAEPEPQIQDTAQTIDSPFEEEKGIILGTENRASQSKKRIKKQAISTRVTRPTSTRRSQKGKQEIDPDIQREIDQHDEDNANIIYDSSPR
jgi:hypothetical protein